MTRYERHKITVVASVAFLVLVISFSLHFHQRLFMFPTPVDEVGVEIERPPDLLAIITSQLIVD